MDVLTRDKLSSALRSLCDSVSSRLWIASPYVGSWNIRSVLGRGWWDRPGIDIRLLTDPAEAQINRDTALRFAEKGSIKKLRGLHAKLFVVDDSVLLTSANLTVAAFSRRHEVGVMLTGEAANSAINLFARWWKAAEEVTKEAVLALPRRQLSSAGEDGREDLPDPIPLPNDPGNFGGSQFISRFMDYPEFLDCYREMVAIYASLPRLWQDLPIYLETDAFMDYLYHHDGKPSKPYLKLPPRKLNPLQQRSEVLKFARRFQASDRAGSDNRQWRSERQKRVQILLSPTNSSKLDRKGITEVARLLNCMGDARVRDRFLKHPQNSIAIVRDAWSLLLHSNNRLPTGEMAACAEALYGFKRSGVQELLGWYKPNDFPLRNQNTNAGMRFLGYSVRAD